MRARPRHGSSGRRSGQAGADLAAADQERQSRALGTEAGGLLAEVDCIQRRKTDLEAARAKWGDLAKRIGQQKGKHHTEWRKHLADAEAKFSQADEESKGLTKQQEALISRKNDLYSRKRGMQGSVTAEDLFSSYGK